MSTLTELANKIIEETNCDPDEAIKALVESDGDYQKAVDILTAKKEGSQADKADDSKQEQKEEEYKVKGKDILKLIKKLIREGNVAKITVKKEDEIIVNIPVNAMAVGLVLLPFASIIAATVALAVDCTIQVQRRGSVVVDVNDQLHKAGSKLEEFMSDAFKK